MAVIALALSACATVSAGAKEIRARPPAAMTIAVADVEGVSTGESKVDLHLTGDGAELRELLVTTLRQLNAASRVEALLDLPADVHADVIIRPRLASPARFTYSGWSDQWWTSGGLWLLTWVGGLAVRDSSYEIQLELDLSFADTSTEQIVSRRLASAPIDLAFLDRNDFLSWQTLQSLILPPFLTTDQVETTSQELTRRAAESVAVQMTRFLKDDYEDFSLAKGGCRLTTLPANGCTVTEAALGLSGTITAGLDVSELVVTTGGTEQVLELESSFRNGMHVADWMTEVPLEIGENEIRLTILAGSEYTRTLRIERLPKAPALSLPEEAEDSPQILSED